MKMDGECMVPGRQLDFKDVAWDRPAGRVNQDVDRTESALRFFDAQIDIIVRTYVSSNQFAPAANTFDPPSNGFCMGAVVSCNERNIRAFVGKCQRSRGANSFSTSGNEGDSVLKSHWRLLTNYFLAA
jgi:hypothetical protein